MANEDLRLSKILDISASSGSVSSGSQGASKINNANIENIFQAFKKIAQKRGLTVLPGDFQRVVSDHPEILDLPKDEQVNALADFITNPVESAQSASAADVEQSTANDIAGVVSEGVLKSETEIEIENLIMQEANSDKSSDDASLNYNQSLLAKSMEDDSDTFGSFDEYKKMVSEGNVGSSYDTYKFSKLSYEEQVAEYKREYAKNLYLNDAKEKHTVEDWVKLGDAGQQKIVESYSKEVDQILKEGGKSVKELLNFADLKFNKDGKNIVIEFLMLQLQSANEFGSIKDFKNFKSINQYMNIAGVLEHKSKINSETSKLTKLEEYILENANFVKNAINSYAKKHKITDDEICFDNIPHVISSSNDDNIRVPIATAIKEYLENVENPTDSQRAQLEFLNTVKSEYLESFGIKYGMDSTLTNNVKNDEKYKTLYENAKSKREQLDVKIKYFMEKYKDAPNLQDKILEYAKSALECADISEVMAFYKLALNDVEAAKALASAMDDIFVVSVSQFDKLGVQGSAIALDKMRELAKTDQNKAVTLFSQAIKQASSLQFYESKDSFIGITNCLIGITAGIAEDFCNKVCMENDPDKQLDEVASVYDAGSDELKKVMVLHTSQLHEKNQIYGLKRGTEGSIERTQLAIAAKIVTRLHKNNQVEAGMLLQERAETLMSKDVAVKNLKSLADQIYECDASNQAAMHKNIVNGKYEEVGVYASSNIYKYDASAQADALLASYSTGNIAIIEAATLQVYKMNSVAVAVMQKQIDVQIRAMEERHSAALVEEYALRQIKKELGFDVDTDGPEYKTKMEAYIAELKSLPKSELYKRIINDMQSWPATIQAMFLEAIVKYCPQLFAMMLDKFGTKLLFAFGQVNSATKNEILMQMLKTPSKRSEAIEYMRSKPNANYSDNLKKLYDEIVDELITSGQMVEEAAPRMLSTNKTRDDIDYTQGSSSLEAIGHKYNWSIKPDIEGNIGLVS